MGHDSSLVAHAIDPHQYDESSVHWDVEADMHSPWRKFFFWHYLQPHVQEWKNKDVLDIGAGSGWLLAELQKYGVGNVLGIEPSTNNCAIAKKLHPDIPMLEKSFEEYQAGESTFDIITFIMSFGHIADVDAAFKKASMLLKDGGSIFCITQDFDYSKTPRHNYELEIQPLTEAEYALSVKRPSGIIADIVRRPDAYIQIAASHGLILRKILPMIPTPELIEAIPTTKEFETQPITQLIIWDKK